MSRFTCISQYNVTRHYGGPEEGGWWYDRRRFLHVVETIPSWVSEDAVYAKVQALNSCRPESRRHLVNDVDGDLEYTCEESPGADDNSDEPRPHYE